MNKSNMRVVRIHGRPLAQLFNVSTNISDLKNRICNGLSQARIAFLRDDLGCGKMLIVLNFLVRDVQCPLAKAKTRKHILRGAS